MLGLAAALILALVLPGAVMAINTTEVTGNVVQGYTFDAPSPIELGDMEPGTAKAGSSTDGSLVGNNPTGYTVTGTDAKVDHKGRMVSGANVLSAPHQIGSDGEVYQDAHIVVTFVDTDGPTDVGVSLYARQPVHASDPVATGYTITITFTVTPKT
jgi:hypothetical protein